MKNTNKLYICDTNIIIRYLVNDDSELGKYAADIFDEIKDGTKKILLLEAVIAECVFVLKAYKLPKIDIVDSLITILSYKGVIGNDKEHLIESLKIFKDNNLHIVDCMILAKAKFMQAEILTFDGKLERLSLSSSLT